MLIFIAVLTGANIALCRFLNAGYAAKNGLNMSTLMNYITGLITALVVLWISGEAFGLTLGGPSPANPFIYLGGAVGVLSWLLSNYLTPKLPAFLLTLLIFVSQLLTALLLDYLLSGLFSPGKLLGGLIVLLGLWHYQRVHKLASAQHPAETACADDAIVK